MLILFTFKSCYDFIHLYLCEYIDTHTHVYAHVKSLQYVWLAFQAPLSIDFSRQENWSGLPCPPSGDLPNPRIEPESLLSPALAGRFFATSAWEFRCVYMCVYVCVYMCIWDIYIYLREWDTDICWKELGTDSIELFLFDIQISFLAFLLR